MELDKHLKKAMDDLNPIRALKLFRRIRVPDLELLGLRSTKPEWFLWQNVPAPPVAIRPSVGQEGASTEDDLTAKLGDIIAANTQLKEALKKGVAIPQLMEFWDFMSLQIAMFVNSDIPGLQKGEYGKQIRGLAQRLKGKQGRFRGNLSGKRVDFSGRTVISPDPNLKIDEVAIPVQVARNMTYPEVVNRHNIEKLRARVRNGYKVWPGANYVYQGNDGFRMFLKYGHRDHIASRLKEGDTVERHLEDGDVVLFNRQPSLHKLSILSHFVKVRPHRTFRLNECVCTPYNADFDGDEMNLHVPQTEEARTEAMQLMGVKHNIVTPKNGEPIISAIQDFVTASFLLSSLDRFYDKKTFVTICAGMLESDTTFDLPPPALIKPQMFWTGKQVFNILMKPSRRSEVKVNIDAQCRDFKQYHPGLHRDLQNDSYLCIRNSEIMCGRMDKSTVGSGKKNSLFYIMYRDFGADAGAQGMNRLSRLCARWLSNQGFSVGISDVTPPQLLTQQKSKMINRVFSDCNQFTQDSKAGKLPRKAGLDDAGTLEQEQVRVLSTVRTDIAGVLTSQLSRKNTPMVMATSGSKGSNINVAQMAALLGQQDIEGKRVSDGFQDRTLPHFAKHEHSPPSKGFVSNSFFSGLNPAEFIFHAVGGRVGLVDTAVKTAETGYMSRRLIKSLEDLSVQYDRTVRNSSADVVQFRFGDDDLDPVDMEASAMPVDFERTYSHVESTTFDMRSDGLDGEKIQSIAEDILSRRRAYLSRVNNKAQHLDYLDKDDKSVDHHESARAFLQSIQHFITGKAEAHRSLCRQKGDVVMGDENLSSTKTLGRSKRKRDDELDDSAAVTTIGQALRRSTRNPPAEYPGTTTAITRGKKKETTNPMSNELVKQLAAPSTKNRFDLTNKLSEKTLRAFIRSCLEKYDRARVEPGHAVGAVGAQSIGEPGTQMTLKTFHFAGVAGMSLTAGVPRIREIINASKNISTPVITCRLERRRDLTIPESLARIVKGRIECLYLEDITSYIQISHKLDRPSSLNIRISQDTITELGVDITVHDVCDRIRNHRKFKGADLRIAVKAEDEIKLSVDQPLKATKRGATGKEEASTKEKMLRLQLLRRFLPSIQIFGYALATRAVVMAEDDPMSNEIMSKRMANPSSLPTSNGNQHSLYQENVLLKTEDQMNISAEAENQKKSAKASGRKPRKSTTKSDPIIKFEDDSANESPITKPAIDSKTLLATKKLPKPVQMHKVMISGYGLRYCMNTPGVDPFHTTTNSIIETYQVLGVEAARSKIISEIREVTKDLSIDPRHMALLADTMTYKGEVLGITRFGLAKMRDSVLQLASFERTADHVFDAGVSGKVDKIEGVSECVIVGKTMRLGTGTVEVVRGMNLRKDGTVNADVERRSCVFEDAWNSA